jgi:sec-independent protein translocase protein TatC
VFGPIGVPELILIFVVALLLFGPRQLPQIGKSLGRAMGEFRRASNEFKRTIEDEVAAEEVRDVKRDLDASLAPLAPAAPAVPAAEPAPPAQGAPPPEPDNRDLETAPDEELQRMSLLEHLDELRRRILASVVTLFVAFLVCWYGSPRIFAWLAVPIMNALPPGEKLAFTGLIDPFMLYVKVALLAAVFVASPVLLLQLWLFLRPGLYRRERRLAGPFILFTTLFFVAGGCFGYYLAFPMVVNFLITVGKDFRPVITIESYFGMMSKILLGLGLVFELPMLIFFLARLGIVTARQLLRWIRWAVLAIFVIAAVITPTPDIATQCVFAIPMIVLYLIGVAVAALFGKRRDEEAEPGGRFRR